MGGGVATAQSITQESAQSLVGVVQTGSSATISATISENDGSAGVNATGTVTDTTITVGTSAASRNVTSATATANEATLTVTNSLSNADTTVGQTSASVDAAGVVAAETAIGVAQANTNGTLTASNTSTFDITATGAVSGSTLRESANAQESVALLNNATNTLNSTVNNVAATTAISNQQTNTEATLTALTNAGAGITAGSTVTNSTVELSGNTERAIAVANTGTNTQSVTGNNVVLPAIVGSASITSGDAAVLGAYVTGSNQDLVGNTTTPSTITATNTFDNNGFSVGVSGAVTGSTLKNDGNVGVAAVRGNDVTNTTTLSANSVSNTASSDTTVAAIGSSQNVADYTLTARAFGENDTSARTNVGGNVASTTITTSGNAVTAEAMANKGSNAIVASVGSIDTSGGIDGSATVTAAGLATAAAAFAVGNSQTIDAQSTVNASLADTLGTLGSGVLTTLGADVTGSTVRSNSNTQTAVATGNTTAAGANSISLTGTDLATTTAVTNYQSQAGVIATTIGGAATTTTGTASSSFSLTQTLVGGAHDNVNNVITAGDYSVSAAGLSAGQILALEEGGWTLSGGAYLKSAIGSAATVSDYASLTGAGVSTAFSTIATTYELPAAGVALSVAEDITGSTLSVDGNALTGTANGNIATNRISVNATSINPGGSVTDGAADPSTVATTTLGATADNALVNNQVVSNAETSTATSAFGIFTETRTDDLISSNVDTSALSVSNNAQLAEVNGSTASNSIALSGNAIDSTAALLSSQNKTGSSTLEATSTTSIYAPVASTDSTIRLNSNSSAASTGVNSVTNTVVATASTLTGSGVDTDAVLTTVTTGNPVNATADFVANNVQTATGSAKATATINVRNADSFAAQDATTSRTVTAPFTTDGIQSGLVEMNRNLASADVNINNAVNQVALTGSTTLDASGGVISKQTNGSSATAQATNNTLLNVVGTGTAAGAGDSTVTLSNNGTVSLASGNVVGNALTATASDLNATAAGTDGSLSATSSTQVADATFTVLNEQINSAAINSSGSNTTSAYLAGGALADAVNGSTVALNNNVRRTESDGNVASNALTVSGATDVAASGGVSNSQTSDRMVSAVGFNTVQLIANADATDGLDAVDSSTLTLSGNATQTRTAANTVTNTVSASSLNLSGTGGAEAALSADTTLAAAGSFTAVNRQTSDALIEGVANAQILANLTADSGAVAVTGSTVTLSGNATQSETDGNVAFNTVTLAGTGEVSSTGGVLNGQTNNAFVTDSAVGTYRVNTTTSGSGTGVVDSTVSLNNNATRSLANGNTATNVLNASSANLVGTGADDAVLATTASLNTADASFAVVNQQASTSGVYSSADSTTAANFVTDTGSNVSGSTIALNGNSTISEAVSNTATNAAILNGATSLAASGGVINAQSNSSIANSYVNAVVQVVAEDASGAAYALNGSTVNLANNSAASRAGANNAVNTLNATTLSSTGLGATATDLALNSDGTNAIDATYAMLNKQGNTANVYATTNVTYGTSFTQGDGAALNASKVAVSNNTASAVAYANSATNSMTLTALNTGVSSAALGNSQTNTGSVLASAASQMAGGGINATGNIAASMFSVGGGSVTATAIGNSVTSTLLRN
ncbi:hypothetical protein IP81_01630 [Novosphingobium sp. AAP83]|nr:hypothetical protein IP81_01630 [Novosphingobium sp. AAP83]